MTDDNILKLYEKMLEATSYKDKFTPQEIIKNMDDKFADELKQK